MTIILGIDPGSVKTGFGLISTEGSKHRYITSGVIRLPSGPLPERLKVIFECINTLIDDYRPDAVAVEEVFVAKSAGSALKLGQARGAAVTACVSRGLPVAEYTARQIKQSVVGSGAANKEQVQHMVKTLLGLPAEPQEDAADGLAAALCHAHTRQSLGHFQGEILKGRMKRGRLS